MFCIAFQPSEYGAPIASDSLCIKLTIQESFDFAGAA